MKCLKIKEKILSILDNDIGLINLMLSTISRKVMNDYFTSEDYKRKYEIIKRKYEKRLNKPYELAKLKKIHWIFKLIDENALQKQYEIAKLDTKIHWIFKAMLIEKDVNYLHHDLFLNKKLNTLNNEKIKIILRTIIETVAQFKFYTFNDSYSNRGKNNPSVQKKKHLKTIQEFGTLLNDLELGGEVRMYKEKKEYYDINNDKFIDFNINYLRTFLDDLSNEIKEINGNNKKSFSESHSLGIKYKYHNPKLDGLFIELKKRLSNCVECKNDNLDSSISLIVEFINSNQV